MEVDTGAEVSIIPLPTSTSHFPNLTLQNSEIQLKTSTQEKLTVLGQREVTVKYGDQEEQLTVTVVEGDGPSLLGRDWLKHLRLNWAQISHVQDSAQVEDLLKEFDELFQDELGTVENFTAKLILKGDAQPKFFRPRPIPFALKEAVEQELDRLETDNIIEKVSHSD